MVDTNLEIVKRLLELSYNEMQWSYYPKSYNEEYIFLANALNDSIRVHEREFDNAFQKAVGEYKQTLLKEGKGYGWFYAPEKLVWLRMQINQLIYAVYGQEYVHEIKFNEDLDKEAYKDLIKQIDRTVLMTEEEKKIHYEECNKIASEILDELLKEDKLKMEV